ncbi:MAG: hypothetical protein LUE86_02995 [Clostridiales bacterium]|nr:hypothetical protein [Clostridiales bacterium]
MDAPQPEPFVELSACDGEAVTKLFDCSVEKEPLCQYTKDKEEAILIIWDKDIGKDCMGMSAVAADQSHDTNITIAPPAMDAINAPPAIVGMDMAVAFRAAARAGR